MPSPHDLENPFPDWLGVKVENWVEDSVRLSLRLAPHHRNRSAGLHGGVIAALLENGAGLSGLYCTRPGNGRYARTLSLTCNFLAPARGTELSVFGRRSGGGRKVYFAETEVRGGDGALVASATSVHRYRTGSEAPEGVPPME